jgi:hypothetical protein
LIAGKKEWKKKVAGNRFIERFDVNNPARIFRSVMIGAGKQPFSVEEK